VALSIFDQLSHNKGTVSSALVKALAQKVFQGETGILVECIDLVSYEAAVPAKKRQNQGHNTNFPCCLFPAC
jgi:hypothetical protein